MKNEQMKNEKMGSKLDSFKWFTVLLIAILVVFGNQYYAQVSVFVRAIIILGASVLAFFLIYTTQRGKLAWQFFQDAKIEIRKVIWPNKSETSQTTLIIFFVTALVALFLWLLDMLLVWIIQLFTGV